MLTAHHIQKSYGIKPILQNISFNINQAERVGLIGPNGCGKSTLMRILAGIEQPDSGTVTSTRPNLRIGYLAQGMDFDPGQTLQTTLNLTPVSQAELEAEIASLASALVSKPNDPTLQEKYDSALNQLSAANQQPSAILGPLGLAEFSLDTPVNHLSGGQKTRLMLARVLLDEPHLLLLDEPTNHLDIEMLNWLENWLKHFKGAAFIVSHDRAFLDNTVTSILELDHATHEIKSYTGNYSDYSEQKEAELAKQMSLYLDQQNEIRRLKADIASTKEQAAKTERAASSIRIGGSDYKLKGYKSYQQGIAKKVAKKAKSREKKLDRFLDSDELVERPRTSWKIKLDFGAPKHQSKDVLITNNLAVGYTPGTPILESINLSIHAGQRIALTGENGTGKTTLIRTIAGKLRPLAGSLQLGATVKLGYMSQEQELINPNLNALQTIQSVASINETEARNFLHYLLFKGNDALRPTSELSFGERARLQLGTLIAQGCTFLLLDEPINHLDITSRERFEEALSSFQGTVLAVIHDRYFLKRFASHIWQVKNGEVKQSYLL